MDKVCEIRVNNPSVFLFETFAAITKLPSNEIRETFCEGLK